MNTLRRKNFVCFHHLISRWRSLLIILALGWELTACGGGVRQSGVTPPAPIGNPQSSTIQVSISPASTTLLPGGAQSFSANVQGTSDQRVTWNIEEVGSGSVDVRGNLVAPLAPTVLHVVAQSVADNSKKAVATVTVNEYTGQSIVTGSLVHARANHTATLLDDGKVLIAGGSDAAGAQLDSAEIYDPASGNFEGIGPMRHSRSGANALRMADGSVLIVGGCGPTGPQFTAERFDPDTRVFSSARGLAIARCHGTATLLPNGKVLVTGNDSAAELYDAIAGTSVIPASMQRRIHHTASLLPDGRVLLAGGMIVDSKGDPTGQLSDRIEIVDPLNNTVQHLGNMSSARAGHVALMIDDRRVLLSGGLDADDSAEIVDTHSRADDLTHDFSPRSFHTATMLPDGRAMMAGGSVRQSAIEPTAAISMFDGQFRALGELQTARSHHTATRLPDGQILVVGGFANVGGAPQAVTSAELVK